MDAYTVNLTRRELVVHPRTTLPSPLVQFTLRLGWDWATDAITTWTGNYVLHLMDTDDTLLPEYNDFVQFYYKEDEAFEAHLLEFRKRAGFLLRS
jgi:hypothetical protein